MTFAKEIAVDGDKITIKRQSESRLRRGRSHLPALVACSSGINEPRYPQLKGIMAAKKKEIKVYTAADLGVGGSGRRKGRARKGSDHRPAAKAPGGQSCNG